MKRILVTAVLAGLLVLSATLIPGKTPVTRPSTTVHADGGAPCSLVTVAGNYGFTATATLILPTSPVPLAAIGTLKLTAQGTASGTEARSVGGSFANETLTATFAINPDCTGVATVKAFESGQLVRTAVESFVLDDNSNEIRAVAQSVTLPDGTNVPAVLTIEAKKMSPNGSE